MFGADKRYLIISINDGVIKVAQASSSGKVERVARASISANSSPEDAAKSLKFLLAPFSHNIPVMCVIPASAATAKTIEVPSTDPDEIKSIINLQANRHTPYSREEVLISHINLGLNTSNNTRVLLVIVHRDVVKERISIVEKAGLEVDKILFAPEAQARFYARALNLKREASAGIIDFSMNSASYIVISRNTVLFVRNIPIGIKTIKQGGDAGAKLQDEIKKSIDAFMQEDSSNEAPTNYWVTAERAPVNNILSVIKQGLNVDFQVKAFLNFVKVSGDVRKRMEDDFSDDSFLDCVAPASVALRCEINLMPDEMVVKKEVALQSKEVSKSGVAAVVIMILVGAVIMSDIYFKDTFLNKNLREKFASQKAQVQMLQEQMNKAKLIRRYINKRMVSLDVIHDLSSITPHTIYLNNIALNEDDTVTIDGIADSMALVYSYVKSLDDSSMFKEASLKSTSTKKDNGKDVAAFEIDFKLNSSTSNPAKEPA